MANKSNAISEEELSGVNGGIIEHRIKKVFLAMNTIRT